MTDASVKRTSILQLFTPSAKQRRAINTIKKHKYTLYGGAMYGGKSYLIRWALVALLVYYYKRYGFKRVQAGLFCEDYPTLKQRQLSRIASEFPKWLGTRHSDHKDYGNCLILSEEYGSGVLMFLNLDRPEKYDSAEFAAIGVDELTKNTEEKFTVLRRRLRWTDQVTKQRIPDCRFIAGSNPGGIGHAWVKKLFLDRIYDENETEQDQFAYVPAKYDDNVIKNPEYENMLNSMPEKMRKAFRDGDWNVFEGQYFSEWGSEWNVEEPFKIPDNWMLFLSLDYGYRAPSSAHWYALDEIGRLHAYRELYETGLTYKALARKIKEMTPEEERPRLEGNMVADPAIFAKKGEDELEKSGAEQMEDATDGWLMFKRGDNNRVIGWGIMREFLKKRRIDGMVTANLIFFKTCIHAMRTIPALVYDSTRVEDVDTGGEDHAGDEARYMVMDIQDMFSEKAPPEEGKRTVKDIREADLKALAMSREEEDNDIEWLNI